MKDDDTRPHELPENPIVETFADPIFVINSAYQRSEGGVLLVVGDMKRFPTVSNTDVI